MIGLAEAVTHVQAPRERVFDLFTTVDGLERWMARKAEVDLRPGGAWRWEHDNDMVSSGEYLEIDAPQRVRFTYGWETGPYADMAPGSTEVEIRFDERDDGTQVTVTHTGVPTAFRDAHVGGWSHFLGVLADLASGRPTPDTRIPGD